MPIMAWKAASASAHCPNSFHDDSCFGACGNAKAVDETGDCPIASLDPSAITILEACPAACKLGRARFLISGIEGSASVDQLSSGRMILGEASGDRPIEFSAFGVDPERRGEIFREHYEVICRPHSTSFEPIHWSAVEMRGADLIPKPTT
jgi:hypothetical protein